MTQNLEPQHDSVFGSTFAVYDKPEMDEFIGFFAQRFAANGLDPRQIFDGKRCLDAGCGNGRGALFMLQNGAQHVVAADISPLNIESTTKNMNRFGFDAFECHETSLEKLPFPDTSFDFVWCNGVLMHAHNPDACLRELARVLRPDGQAWIYVYGSDGIYWYSVRRIREMVRDITPAACMAALQTMRYSARFVAEYLDDWKVPYLRTYTHQDFGTRLTELGFESAEPLPYGVAYDTSQRRHLHPDQTAWIGEGDLRYLVIKSGQAEAGGTPISDSEHGSDVEFAPEIIERFAGRFDSLAKAVAGDPLLALAASANLQFTLRELMSDDGPLKIDAYEQAMDDILDKISIWKRERTGV